MMNVGIFIVILGLAMLITGLLYDLLAFIRVIRYFDSYQLEDKFMNTAMVVTLIGILCCFIGAVLL